MAHIVRELNVWCWSNNKGRKHENKMELRLVFMLLMISKHVCKAVDKMRGPRHRLMDALLGNNSYTLTRDIIPLSSENPVIRVYFDFNVHQILELNEKKQIMNLNIWVKMKWTNSFLKWNPKDYGDITKLTVNKDKVWIPDLTLWNRAVNDASIYQRMDTRIVIEHDGTCSWYAPVTTSSTCAIRIKYFPFDNQTCGLSFGSWIHTTSDLVFVPCKTTCANMNYFKPNSEWALDQIYGEIVNQTFKSGDYSVIECRLEVTRKSLFYVMNMVVPCTIIALLCCLTFYLPANNGERASLVITVLLAMTVYMLIVAESMPPTPEAMPLVQTFYLVTIIETASCLFATCMVVKWHENTEPMPDWIYAVFNCFLRKVLHIEYTENKNGDSGNLDNDGEFPAFSPTSPTRNQPRRKESKTSQCNRNNSDTSDVFPMRYYSTIQETIPDVTVRSRSEDAPEIYDSTENKQVPRDWKLAARVLNKVFLITFTTIFVLSIAVIFAGVKSWFTP